MRGVNRRRAAPLRVGGHRGGPYPSTGTALEADNLRMPVVGDSFRTIAAGITLLQRRVDKEVRLEALLLARA